MKTKQKVMVMAAFGLAGLGMAHTTAHADTVPVYQGQKVTKHAPKHVKIKLRQRLGSTYTAHNVTNPTTATANASTLINSAMSHLGEHYVYGGTTPGAFDCSGFTQYVFRSQGTTIPRVAQAQYDQGTHISKANLQVGDLVFFGGSSASIGHVGIYLGNGQMIDAQNRGVITESINAPWWHYVGAARY